MTDAPCICGRCETCTRAVRSEELRQRRAAKFGCVCGNPRCDCAKWERIYKEKFEDPTYYTRPYRQPGSSLGDAQFTGMIGRES